MTARKYLKRIGGLPAQAGFTLVELLIVIALLGVIALIVIAAINPIEQANRARDTGQKADASQLLSAIDRYFAARQQFPWVVQGEGAFDNDSDIGFLSVEDGLVGLCTIGDCSTPGVLISDEELKPEFMNRRFIGALLQDQLQLGKAQDEQSVYICYIPMAKSNRTKACDDGYVYRLVDDGTRTAYDCVASGTPSNWAGGSVALSYYVCVPQ